MWGLLEMSVGDGLCPQEKALEARWMESSREVNTKMERIREISNRGRQESKHGAAGRTESEDVGSAAGLAGFPREACTGLRAGAPARPSRGLWGKQSFLQVGLRRSPASWELDSSAPQKAVCS